MTASLGRGLGVAAALVGGLALAHPAAAQSTSTDARWNALLGCWQPSVSPLDFARAGAARLVCVVPAGGSAVNVAVVADGKVERRERIDVTGQQAATKEDGCTGWRSARWSANGASVYLRSQATCANNIERRTSGVLALAPTGELLDVEGLGVGKGTAVRALRYREAATPAALAGELAGVKRVDGFGAAGMVRTAAAAPLAIADVADAARALDPEVTSAFLAERRQGFSLDARRLEELADAKVPSGVIDMMVALSYPKRFAVNGGAGTVAARAPMTTDDEVVTGRTIPVTIDDHGYGGYYGNGGFYSPFGYGYGYGYGSQYGYGYGGYGYYPAGGPVIIVRDPNAGSASPTHGRMVNGRGYEPPEGATGTRTTRNTDSSPGSSGSSAGSSTTSASPSSSSGSTSSGTRTAHEKP